MVKGKKRNDLKAETILAKIDPYDIYRFYIGDFTLGRAIHSPLRKDENPSFCVKMSSKSGNIYHIDYAKDDIKGDCFDFVQQMYGLNFDQALKKVAQDFGIIDGTEKYKKIVSTEAKEKALARPKHIHIITRNFSEEELAYWSEYHLTKEDLVRDRIVFAIKQLRISRKVIPNYDKTLRFGYYFNPFWKVYRPLMPKDKKWIFNNTPNDTMYGLENIREGEDILVTKSVKDYLVLRKVFPNVCGVQHESVGAINKTNIELLQKKCKNVYIFFDNDEVGVRSCTYYNQFGFNYVNIPKKYHEENRIKDPSDFVKAFGFDALKDFLAQKSILGLAC